MPYWQVLSRKIPISIGSVYAFNTGVVRDKTTALATEYYIQGVVVRRQLKDKTFAAFGHYVLLQHLLDADIQQFELSLQTLPEWEVFKCMKQNTVQPQERFTVSDLSR